MFDQLFKRPVAVARHRTGPLLEERLAFLTHLANQGYSRRALRTNAPVICLRLHTCLDWPAGLERP